VPGQAPTTYELAINTEKTARTLGLDLPNALLVRASDEFE